MKWALRAIQTHANGLKPDHRHYPLCLSSGDAQNRMKSRAARAPSQAPANASPRRGLTRQVVAWHASPMRRRTNPSICFHRGKDSASLMHVVMTSLRSPRDEGALVRRGQSRRRLVVRVRHSCGERIRGPSGPRASQEAIVVRSKPVRKDAGAADAINGRRCLRSGARVRPCLFAK